MGTVNGSVAVQPDSTLRRDPAPAIRRHHQPAAPAWPLSASPRRRPDDAELRRRVSAERQSLAGALHDEIGPLLFAIAASTQRAQVLHRDDVGELRRTVDEVADRVRAASDRLRELLTDAAPADPAEAVPTAVERDLADLRARAGVAAHLVVRGPVRRLDAAIERTVLNCLRQAVYNVERHAGATVVVVTLSYSPEQVTLVVLDDGCGVEAGTSLAGVPDGGRHWGFASMSRQAEQNGGEVTLCREDGGTALRLRLPA